MRTLLALLVGICVYGQAAQAQRSAAVPRFDLPAGRWSIDYGQFRCTLMRRIGDAQSPLLAISTTSGSQHTTMMLIKDTPGSLPSMPRSARVTFMPGGQTSDVEVATAPGRERRAVYMNGVFANLTEELDGATGLRIESRGNPPVVIPLADGARAVAALHRCHDDLHRTWGIDVEARARFTRQPRQTAGTFTSSDYPSAALAREQAGTTVARLTVGTDGIASDCRIIRSSRVPSLDTTSCAVMTARYRFEPALDAEGRPVSAMVVRSVRWGIADDGDGGMFTMGGPALPPAGNAN